VIADAGSGRLRIVFEVLPNGSVDEVKVENSTVGNATLEACLARTFKKMKFPAAKKPTRASFPFNFHGEK
jgi:TonB family protein